MRAGAARKHAPRQVRRRHAQACAVRNQARRVRDHEAQKHQDVGEQEQAQHLPVETVGHGEPRRGGRHTLRLPAADGAAALCVAGVEAPFVSLAVGSRAPGLGVAAPRQPPPCDHGDSTSSGTFSAGALRAQIHAAAEASSRASRVRNIQASGTRLAGRAVPIWPAGGVGPKAPPWSPAPKPPKSPNPPKPPKPPKPNAAPPEPTCRSAKPSPRTYSAVWVGTPGPGEGCVTLMCRPVAHTVTCPWSIVFCGAT